MCYNPDYKTKHFLYKFILKPSYLFSKKKLREIYLKLCIN